MFEIDDRVICKSSGVEGNVIKIYKPTACEEQPMVRARLAYFNKTGM